MSNKDFSFKKKFKYSSDQSEYTFRLKKRNWKWLWWLLLLLPLLLFIRCDKNINVTAIDTISEMAVPDVEVHLEYTAHTLYKDGEFFHNELIKDTLITDQDGKGTFKDLPCSVFSYIFYALNKASFTINNLCYSLEPDSEGCNFHYRWNKTLYLTPKTIDIEMVVVDRETKELLAGAVVNYRFSVSGKETIDSITTTPDGKFTLKGVPECGIVMLERVECYGYADTTNVSVNIPTVMSNIDSTYIPLTPLKERFTYFIKNKFTKEPIPGAKVTIVLTSGKGNVVRANATTNVDGKGFGAYEDAFVLANLQIKASKKHYKNGQLDGKYNVETFIKQPDHKRTVYLDPEPYMVKFQNIDSVTNKPIAGVTNNIHINSISGETEDITEMSNRNGIFYVKAMEGDQIDIHSELSPYYEYKHTHISKFSEGKIIYMNPIRCNLDFRTMNGETEEVLPDCNLSISTSESYTTSLTTSGNGYFMVENVILYETISITASKAGYSPNDSKVNNDKVIDLLNSSQERRDIPLFPELPPCDAGANGVDNADAGTVSQPMSYNMGVSSGTFYITYETGNGCSDCIDIYNHRSGENYLSGVKIFSTGQIITPNGKETRAVPFSNGSVITIIVTTGSKDDSMWNYHISCPQ